MSATTTATSSRRAVLQHPSLNGRIPTSAHLSSLISSAKAQLDAHEASIVTLRKSLHDVLRANLDDVTRRRDELQALPSQIEEAEDRLLEITSDLKHDDSGDGKGDASLIDSLERQQAALVEMRAARDYFGILAEAEDLSNAVAQAEADEAGCNEALRHMDRLARLAAKAQSLGSSSKSAGDETPRSLKAIDFITAQRDASYAALVSSRCERLRKALKSAGWPPIPAQVAAHTNQRVFSVQQILADPQVREAWKGLCRLQRKASRRALSSSSPSDDEHHTTSKKGGWLDPPSALISHRPTSSLGGNATHTSRPAAGDRSFVPLLAVKVLMEPLILRFRYHFDSERDTNRLDKPEWFLSHALMLVREHAAAFLPSTAGHKGGPIAQLCRSSGYGKEDSAHLDLMMELLHHLLEPLRNKLDASRRALLDAKSELLAHTISEAVAFDATLRELVPEALGSPIDEEGEDSTHLLDSAEAKLEGGAIRLSEVLLSDQTTFDAWLAGERDFAQERFDEILDSAEAWTISGESGEEDEDAVEGSWSAAQQGSEAARLGQEHRAMKTTRSARGVMELVNSLTLRYEGLNKLSYQVPFVLIQLSLLRGYGNRLVRSLDAFESLSSAFARHLPGGIESGSIPGSAGPESDMVRGLRGLGRLLKAYLSASYIAAHLERMGEASFFAEMGSRLEESEEGRAALRGIRRLEGEEEERELDGASLGELVRRGVRAGGEAARRIRPLGKGAGVPSGPTGSGTGSPKSRPGSSGFTDATDEPSATAAAVDIWSEPKIRLRAVLDRAAKGIERLVVTEVNEQLRAYSLRSWCAPTSSAPGAMHSSTSSLDSSPVSPSTGSGVDASDADEGDADADADADEDEIPTSSLLPALSILSTHLGHLVPSLPANECVPIYRRIAQGVARNVTERVVMGGGAHRFDAFGARRFARDFTEGWLAVVRDVDASTTSSRLGGNAGVSETERSYPMGRKVEAPWRSLRDVCVLLCLPSSTSSTSAPVASSISPLLPPTPSAAAAAASWTLPRAIRALFDGNTDDDVDGFAALRRDLGLDERMEVRSAREVVRRRVECWK